MTHRTLTSASEAIDEVDSPVDGLEDGSLSITSQTTGNVTGNHIFIKKKKFQLRISPTVSLSYQMFGAEPQQSQDAHYRKMDRLLYASRSHLHELCLRQIPMKPQLLRNTSPTI